MRLTRKDKQGRIYLDGEAAPFRKEGARIYGLAVERLAQYEDVAASPVKLAKIVSTAQLVLDGQGYTPKQAAMVQDVVNAKCEEAMERAFSFIRKKLLEAEKQDAVDVIDDLLSFSSV